MKIPALLFIPWFSFLVQHVTANQNSFEPRRYKQLLDRTEKDLTQQLSQIDAKRGAFSQASPTHLASSFGINKRELELLKESQGAAARYLETRRKQLTERIAGLQKQRKALELSPIKGFAEESDSIKKLTLEQQSTILENKLTELQMTRGSKGRQEATGPLLKRTLTLQQAQQENALATKLSATRAELAALQTVPVNRRPS